MESSQTPATAPPAPPAPAVQARRLLRAATAAALATAQRDGGGWPLPSLVLMACDLDATPLLLVSGLAEHTRNLVEDDRAGLLIDGTAGLADPLTGPRLSLLARAQRLEPGSAEDRRLRDRYVSRHPGASLYAGFGDFALWRLVPTRGHLVAGFGRITWIEGEELRLPAAAWKDLVAREAGIVQHLNDDHAAAINLCAEKLAGAGGAGWSVAGIDPEGCDLRRGAATLRLDFDQVAPTADAVRQALIALIGRARQLS
jgi:putative heme iron utilization protein